MAHAARHPRADDALSDDEADSIAELTQALATSSRVRLLYALRDDELGGLIAERARTYFGKDTDAPLKWEPGGEDFLSPSLEEAALMSRILPAGDFRRWMKSFLPALKLAPAIVSDRTDPKIVHLDGLNLSRARCLYALSVALGRPALARLGDTHAHNVVKVAGINVQ